MEFVYDRTVRVSVIQAWDALTNPEAMEPHLPGTAKVTRAAVDTYRVSMKISMGFLRPTVNADAKLSDIVQHRSFSIRLSGKSMGAGVSGSAVVALTPVEGEVPDSTRVRMTGSVETSGLLKKVSDARIDAAVTGFLDSYFESVESAAIRG